MTDEKMIKVVSLKTFLPQTNTLNHEPKSGGHKGCFQPLKGKHRSSDQFGPLFSFSLHVPQNGTAGPIPSCLVNTNAWNWFHLLVADWQSVLRPGTRSLIGLIWFISCSSSLGTPPDGNHTAHIMTRYNHQVVRTRGQRPSFTNLCLQLT